MARISSARKPFISKELADSFAAMTQFAAWKHLEHCMTDWEKDKTLSDDNKPLTDLTLVCLAETRGFRKAIQMLRDEVYQHIKN